MKMREVLKMKNRIYATFGLLIIACCIWGCGKKEEPKVGELKPQESVADSLGDAWTIKPKPINYDSMLAVISDIVEAIRENPTDLDYRQQLIAACYDSVWDTILAAGTGKPQLDAETAAIAAKYAERAAIADALRWAGWIKRWTINPNAPLDSLEVHIQQHRVVAKKVLPDNQVVVLIEVRGSRIIL